jgi:hypothetical protein
MKYLILICALFVTLNVAAQNDEWIISQADTTEPQYIMTDELRAFGYDSIVWWIPVYPDTSECRIEYMDWDYHVPRPVWYNGLWIADKDEYWMLVEVVYWMDYRTGEIYSHDDLPEDHGMMLVYYDNKYEWKLANYDNIIRAVIRPD